MRVLSGTRNRTDARVASSQIAVAVSRMTRADVCQASQVSTAKRTAVLGYQTGITLPSTNARRLSRRSWEAGSNRHAAGLTKADTGKFDAYQGQNGEQDGGVEDMHEGSS